MVDLEIDTRQLLELTKELGATPKQVKLAMLRAVRRTEATLRKMSSTGLTKELYLRSAAVLRKRIRSATKKVGNGDVEATIWHGLNPVAARDVKGRTENYGKGAFKGDYFFDGGFSAKMNSGRKSVFKRKGKGRLPIEEQTVAIDFTASAYIENEVFNSTIVVFWNHFERDLRARVKYQPGAA